MKDSSNNIKPPSSKIVIENKIRCPKCDKEINEDSKFCSYCGNEIDILFYREIKIIDSLTNQYVELEKKLKEKKSIQRLEKQKEILLLVLSSIFKILNQIKLGNKSSSKTL